MSLIICCLAFLGSLPGADGGEESHLLKLWQERQKITSGEFTMRTHFLEKKSNSFFAGAEWEFHLWWTSDLSVYRMDRHRIERKRPEDVDHQDNIAFDGETYRFVYRKDSPNYNISEYRNRKPSGAQVEPFDPRLFGLYPELMEAFRNATPQELSRIVSKAVSVERGDEAGGTFEIYRHLKNNVNIVYSYHYNPAGQPIRIEAEDDTKLRLRYELRMEYDAADGGAASLPTRIEMKAFHGGALDTHEVIEIQASNLNAPVDRSLCTWAALQPHPGARLVVDDEPYANVSQYWDGERMRPIPPGALFSDLMVVTRSNWNMKLFIAVNVAVICAAVIAYRLLRRRWAAGQNAA